MKKINLTYDEFNTLVDAIDHSLATGLRNTLKDCEEALSGEQIDQRIDLLLSVLRQSDIDTSTQEANA